MADRSVHCVVTSPPYWGLRDYGAPGQLGLERTPEVYVAALVAVFREVWRVLRDDGTLWLNLGDCYATGAGKVGERPGGGAQGDGWAQRGAMTQPNRMPIPGLKPKDLVGIPWRVAFALQTDGWYLRSDIVWSKPNPMPESVTDRPTKSHEYLFLLAKRERYYYDAEAIKEAAAYPGGPNSPESIASPYGQGFTRKAKAWPGIGPQNGATRNRGEEYAPMVTHEKRNRRSVWEIATQPYPEAHFATFPEALVEPCVLAGSPEAGMVLDPFAGSGTVGQVCHRLGRRFVGLELKPDYCRMAYRRTAQMGLI
jgi:DNA modification methylase